MSEIKLILAGTPPGKPGEPQLAAAEALPEVADLTSELSPEEIAQASADAEQINLHDGVAVATYGSALQKKLKELTGDTLQNVAGRDLGEIGKILSDMMSRIQSLSTSAPRNRFLQAIRPAPKPEVFMERYEATAKALAKMQKQLEGWRMTLLVDIETMNDLYDQVISCYRQLSVLIVAGQQKLQQVRTGELASLRLKSSVPGAQEAILMYNDLQQKCNNFEKHLHDLELTKTLYLQTALQIQLSRQNDEQLVAQIQSNVNHAIAAWQQNVAAALTTQNSAERFKKENTELLATIEGTLALQSAEQQRRATALQGY